MLNRLPYLLIAAAVSVCSIAPAQSTLGTSDGDIQQPVDCSDPANAATPACQTGFGQNNGNQQNPYSNGHTE
jgi:hypothetical protein